MLKISATFLAALTCAIAQVPPSYWIETIAGGVPLRDGGPAAAALLAAPQGVAVDAAGNIFVADTEHHVVRRIAPDGAIATVAGNGQIGDPAEGPATQSPLWSPQGLAFDAAGNLYIAQVWALRRVAPDGTISTVWKAPGTYQLSSVAVDKSGNVFAAVEYGCYVVKIAADGTARRFAGIEGCGLPMGDGGPAAAARMGVIRGMACDPNGNLYIAEGHARLRRVTADGIISSIRLPQDTLIAGVAVDRNGDLILIAPSSGLFRLKPDGTAIKFLDQPAIFGNWLPQTGRPDRAINPAVSESGTIFVPDPYTHGVYAVRASGPLRIAGARHFSGDGGPARNAVLDSPAAIAVDGSSSVYIADAANRRIRKIDPDGMISTVAGNGSEPREGDAPVSLAAALAIGFPSAVAASGKPGDFAFAEWRDAGIWRVTAGEASRQPGISGGRLVLFSRGIVVAPNGDLVYGDYQAGMIFSADPQGKVRHVAGSGTRGYSGDGGPAISAALNGPRGLALDGKGRLYIADAGNARVRMVDGSGIIRTLAGGGDNERWQDGDAATSAKLYGADAVAADSKGNVFVVEKWQSRLLMVDSDGRLWTVAGGTWEKLYTPERTPARGAPLNAPSGVAVDAKDRIYVSEEGGHRIRLLTPDPAANRAEVYEWFVVDHRVGTSACPYPFTECRQTTFPLGTYTFGLFYRIRNLTAGSHNWRLRFVRPDGSVAMDSADQQRLYDSVQRDFWLWFTRAARLDVEGTWEMWLDLDGTTVVKAPFEVQSPPTEIVNAEIVNGQAGTPACQAPFAACRQSVFPIGRQKVGVYYNVLNLRPGTNVWRVIYVRPDGSAALDGGPRPSEVSAFQSNAWQLRVYEPNLNTEGQWEIHISLNDTVLARVPFVVKADN